VSSSYYFPLFLESTYRDNVSQKLFQEIFLEYKSAIPCLDKKKQHVEENLGDYRLTYRSKATALGKEFIKGRFREGKIET
jgi:hypothetical protein